MQAQIKEALTKVRGGTKITTDVVKAHLQEGVELTRKQVNDALRRMGKNGKVLKGRRVP